MQHDKLAQTFRPSESGSKSRLSAIEIIPRLVEDWIGLEDLQDLFLPREDFSREEEFRQLLHGNIGPSALLFEKFRALRARRREFLHPLEYGV